MKFIDAQEMRALDHLTIHKAETPGHVLMERAGRGLAQYIQRCCEALEKPSGASLLMVAGRGNNGGDVFVAARMLGSRHRIRVWLAAEEKKVQGDAAWALSVMKQSGVKPMQLPKATDWDRNQLSMPLVDLAVDGLLGTGTKGAPRGTIGKAVEYLARMDCPVIAVDLPSGLDSDTGKAEGACARARATVTLGCPKTGFLQSGASSWTGSIHLVDIGIPARFIEQAEDHGQGQQMIHEAQVRAWLPARKPDAHKGDFGRVLLIGGSRGLAGALSLSARAALRSGAGLVTALTPKSVAPLVAVNCPEAMVHGGEQTAQGTLASAALDPWMDRLDEFDAVLCGPGIGRHAQTRALVERLLEQARKPLVLDADALTVLEGDTKRLKVADAPCVLTPHPGELASLLGSDSTAIQSDRLAAVKQAANATDATVVLKGAGTLVASGGEVRINLNGNPGMATGGTGDVLAGLLTGLLGQGLSPFDAASAAVYLHGAAGDYVAWEKGEAGLIAGDLVEALPRVMR